MKNQKDIEKIVEETLNSLDGMHRAEPRAFFFTRLQQKLQNKKSLRYHLERFIAKPAIALAGVALLLILNISLIISKEESNQVSDQEEQALTEEYTFIPATIYEFENGNNNE